MNKTPDRPSQVGRKLLAASAAALISLSSAFAQIPVPAGGSGLLTFDVFPTVASGWSTLSIGGDGNTATTGTGLDTLVNANINASAITTALGTSGTQPPSQNAIARWNDAGFYVQTRPTGNGYNMLLAKLRNDSGIDQGSITVSYDWAQLNASINEHIPGHRVYFSVTGTAGSWTLIPELSNFTMADTALRATAQVPVGAWGKDNLLYLLFVDDNGPGGNTAGQPLEGAYTIDNLEVTYNDVYIPVAVNLSSPASGLLTASAQNPANINMAAIAVGTIPPSSVEFYVNDELYFTDVEGPFTAQILNAAPGTYRIYAIAHNNVDPAAVSATSTVVVRDEFVSFTGSPITETFDGMLPDGTETPIGWYAGTTSPFNTVNVVVSSGNHRPISAAQALNVGTDFAADRALGLQATSGDRSMVVRIQNNTASSITAITLNYDGEVWRPYTNVAVNPTDHKRVVEVSLDNGGTWISTDAAFDFTQHLPIAEPPGSVPPVALDGNLPENRVPGITGTFTLPSPVAPSGTIYIRWFDDNESGDEGILAIDDFTFSATLGAFTPTVAITAPADGSSFPFRSGVTITAVPSMANPVTNVTFYADNLSTVIGTDTNSPFTITVTNLSVGTHSLYVVAQDNSGVRATNTALVSIAINPNVLPAVEVTSTNGVEWLVGDTVLDITATASDSDGTIARVDFYLDGTLWFSDTTSPYEFDLSSITAGTHALSAVVVDNGDARATNTISLSATNPPGISVVVPNGAEWKYLDNGTDQGTAWRDASFNDAAWASGLAELGYGDGPGRPEHTVIGFGPNSNQKYATTYFRKKFNVANPGSYSSLTVRVMQDDHAIVYLNGTQIFSDMTNTVITYQTYETPDISGDGTVWHEATVPASLLVAGENVLAAEVHQTTANSSDLGFDLMLWGQGGAPAGPSLTIARLSPTQVQISWGADAAGSRLQSNIDLGNPTGWIDVQTGIAGAGSTVIDTTGTMRYFRLRNP